MTTRRVCDGPGSCRNVGYVDENGDYDVRGIKVSFEVPDDYVGRAYCSLECAAYAGEGVIHARVFQQEGNDDATS